MGEKDLQALWVLCGLSPASADDGPDNHGAMQPSTTHDIPFGGMIDDLVHGKEEKIISCVHNNNCFDSCVESQVI